MVESQSAVRHKNQKVGTVVSTKMAKTIVVEVSRRVPHSRYRRIVSRRKKFYAHDEKQVAEPGDRVRIVECRPLSRLKHWRLAEVIWKASRVGLESRRAEKPARERRKERKPQ